MKTVAEIREAAKERVEDAAGTGKKAAFAMMGAPVVAGRRIAGYAGRVGRGLQKEFEAWVAEGERLSGEVSDGRVVAELKERVDFEHLHDRVEKLKDQLEDVLANWRETFRPGADESVPVATKTTTKKPAARAVKKPAAKKAAPAAKKASATRTADES